MAFGLTAQGFVKKLFADIHSDLKAAIVAVPGLARVNLARDSLVGGVVVAVAGAVSEVWDVAQELYSAFDADSATGRALDNAVAFVGKYRKAATATLVECTVNLDNGTYPAGALVAHVDGNADLRFHNRDAVTRSGGTGNVAGVIFECETLGALDAPAGTITVIASAYPGWNSVTNPEDGVRGRNVETDAELRARRLVFSDANTLANHSKVKKLFTFENVLDVTVGTLPPHSFEAVVFDGTDDGTSMTDQEIADALWASKPAGIQTVGDITASVTDENGATHSVKFSRPVVVEVYLKVYVTKGAGWDAVASPAAIKAALVEYADAAYTCGSTVVRSFLFAPITSITGVVDVTDVRLGLASNPTGTANLTMTAKQIPRLDTSRITVIDA